MTSSRAAANDTLQSRIDALGPWFHNMQLGDRWTAPDHFLGNHPGDKFRRIATALPADLTGRTVLDIGCNAGFHALEMKRRGADRVLGIDSDPRYLAQARLAAEVTGIADIEFALMSVYDVAALGERFDIVLFMGVFYHLRHPLLALDLIRSHVAGDLMVFQSLQRGSNDTLDIAEDYPFAETAIFEQPAYPRMQFVEHRYAGDPSNWWLPNRAASEAMLRSAGFTIEAHPESDVYICRRAETLGAAEPVYPARPR